MKLILSENLGKEFIFKFLPSFIFKRSIGMLYDRQDYLRDLLKNNFNYTIDKFIDEYKKSFSIKKFGKYYILSIKQNEVDKIIRAIDYGIIGYKPQHIFDSNFNYIKNNLIHLYELWLYKMI